jgi:hypothetical protein
MLRKSQETTGPNVDIPAMTESNAPPSTTAVYSAVQSRNNVRPAT